MIKPKEFSKSDLQGYDKVTLRNGKVYNVHELVLRCWNENLTINGNKQSDIIKVERTTTETIFERVEPIELVRGEIYCLEDEEDKWLFRFSKKNKNQVFSFLALDCNTDFFDYDGYFKVQDTDKLTVATPQQKAALIAAEIKNGWLWDDETKELIKID